MSSTYVPPSGQQTGASPASPAPVRRVTDAPTRMFHWLAALSFAGAYLTADSEHWRLLHVTLGYTLGILLVFRIGYGIWGPRQAGLSLLWRKLGVAPAWLQSLRSAFAEGRVGAVNWRQGQNLGMAMAVLLILALVLPVTLTGYGTFNEWGTALGDDWLEELHEFFGNAMLLVVMAHLVMLAGFSVWRRQNMAQPMFTGLVPGKGPSPVENNRVWLAAVLLLVVLGFGVWNMNAGPLAAEAQGVTTMTGSVSADSVPRADSTRGEEEDD